MGERQRAVRPEEMATTSTAVATTVPPQTQEEPVERVAVITLRPTCTEPRRRVVWAEDTVDNEHMNKKKSKCCCIYEKPRRFDESDSEDSDDECEHCYGHVEKRAQKQEPTTIVQESPAAEPPADPGPSPQPPAPAPPNKTGLSS